MGNAARIISSSVQDEPRAPVRKEDVDGVRFTWSVIVMDLAPGYTFLKETWAACPYANGLHWFIETLFASVFLSYPDLKNTFSDFDKQKQFVEALVKFACSADRDIAQPLIDVCVSLNLYEEQFRYIMEVQLRALRTCLADVFDNQVEGAWNRVLDHIASYIQPYLLLNPEPNTSCHYHSLQHHVLSKSKTEGASMRTPENSDLSSSLRISRMTTPSSYHSVLA